MFNRVTGEKSTECKITGVVNEYFVSNLDLDIISYIHCYVALGGQQGADTPS